MFDKFTTFTTAAKKLAQFRAAASSETDQLEAARNAAADALADSEHNRLKRQFEESQERLMAHRRRQENELARLQADVRMKCPAASTVEELLRQCRAQISILQSDWIPHGTWSRTPAAVEEHSRQCAERDGKLESWFEIQRRLQDIPNSTTPFTSLAALLDKHRETLPELRLFVFAIPESESEMELADVHR